MREGWRLLRLGDLLSSRREMVSVASLDSVPYAGVHWYGLGVYPRSEAQGSSVKARELARIHTGQVVYNRMWSTRGAFGVAGPDADGCVVTNDFPVFDVLPAVLPAYFSLLFSTPEFQSAAASLAMGTTERRRLLERDFTQLIIELPPLAEQRRIVDLLAATDGLASAAAAEREAARSTLVALRENLIAASAAPARPLADLLTDIDGGYSPVTEGRRPLPGERAVLKLSAVRPARFDGSESKAVTRDVILPERALVKEGDVLITRSNTPDTVGAVCRVRSVPADTYLSDLMLRLHPGLDVAGAYLAEALNTLAARRQITASAKGTSGSMRKISRSTIRQLEIPIPESRQAQEQIVQILQDAGDLVDAANSTAVCVGRLRQVLVQELLAGARSIPASYDRLLEGVA